MHSALSRSRHERRATVKVLAACLALGTCFGTPLALGQSSRDGKASAPAKASAANKASATKAAVAPKAGDAIATPAGIPGGVLRWSAPGTRGCREGKRSWKPLGETCYYPIDLLQRPGTITLTRVGSSRSESAKVKIEAFDYGTQEVELPDIPQRDPSAADQKRVAREGQLLAKVFQRKDAAPQFALPLGPPAKPMAPGKAFGVNRVFNGKPAPQPHMGTDYLTPAGTPVIAVADGTVALAQDLFHPGNAVFVDHGDGLVTMSFHLSEIAVQPGQTVKKGELLGKVGTTGRSTGAHLYFGVRWHNARIDPKWVLEDPAKIPSVR